MVLLYVAFGVAYALKVPKWNAPDEPAHYNYVRHIATTATLPVLQAGDYDQSYLEQLTTARFPDSMPIDRVRYESHQPPLYYLLAAAIYLPADGLPLDARVFILRLFSVLLGSLLIVVAYLVVRQALPGLPLLAVGTAAFVAGVPMNIAMSAAVNNDTLGNLVLALVLLVLVTGLRHGFPYRRCLVLGALLGVALLTKLTIYVALALVPMAIWARRRLIARGSAVAYAANPVGDQVVSPAATIPAQAGSTVEREPSFVKGVAVAYGVALALSAWWFARNALTYGGLDLFGLARHDAVVLGQPRTAYDLAAVEYFLNTTFQSFWAQFGWMGVLIDRRLYLALAVLSTLAALGFALYLWRLARRPSRLAQVERWALALLGLCWLLVLGELVYYNLTFIQAQGRYLFPAIVPIGLFFTIGLLELVPRALAPLAILGLYLALLGLDFVCLVRFIAPYFGTL